MRAKKSEFDLFFKNMNKCGDDFSKIKSLLHSNNGKDFFLGVRENYLSIYYKGMSIATVKALKKGGCSYTLSYYYLNHVKDENGNNKYDDKTSGYYALSSDVFWDEDKANLRKIKSNVEKHVFGFGTRGYVYLEKVCQQWIINNNNNNPDSDWYYVDMEYIYKKDKKNEEDKGEDKHPFGRADLIAIKKQPNDNDNFDVAFIELKVGTEAYGVSIQVPDEIKGKEKRDEHRKKIKEMLKNDLWNDGIKAVKLGSGLASHVVDFMHFFADEEAKNQLRKEILGILDVHKTFGLIEKTCPLYELKDINHIEVNPDIYIVTYSDVPCIEKYALSEKAKQRYVPSLRQMKEDFGKYFYAGEGASSLPVEELINKDQIKGFIDLKHDYLKFLNTKEPQISCVQKIKGQDFKFVFRFIDTCSESTNSVNCIE